MSNQTEIEKQQSPSATAEIEYVQKDAPIVWMEKKFLILPKILYFTLYMAYYTCYTFKGKFFKEVLGFKDSEFIFTQAGMYLVVWIGSTAWNYISDLTCRPKLVLIIGSISMGVSFQLFNVIPFIPKPWDNYMSIVITILYTFSYSSVQPMLDAIVVHMLSMSKIEGVGKELYGRQRLWGTFGYGFVTFVVGKAIDASSVKGSNPTPEELRLSYMPMFYISASTVILFLVIFMLFIPNDQPEVERAFRERRRALENEKKALEKAEIGQGTKLTKTQEILALLKDARFIMLLLITLFVGMCRQNLSTIRPMYTETYIAGENNPDKKQSVAIAAWAGLIPEIIMFFLGKNLLKKFGTYKLMIVSLVTIAIRVWCYYLVPEGNPDWLWFLYVVEIMKGLSMGSLQLAAVQMCVEIAGDSMQATAQGVYTGVYNGFSGTVGTAISGVVMMMTNQKGYKLNFLQSSIVTSCSLLLILIYPFLKKKRQN